MIQPFFEEHEASQAKGKKAMSEPEGYEEPHPPTLCVFSFSYFPCNAVYICCSHASLEGGVDVVVKAFHARRVIHLYCVSLVMASVIHA